MVNTSVFRYWTQTLIQLHYKSFEVLMQVSRPNTQDCTTIGLALLV